MSELRVPTRPLAVEIVCADGRVFHGRVFLSATASRHTGPMRAEEWMNDDTPFFPFVPDGAAGPVLLNKREVLVLTVPAAADSDDLPEEAEDQYPHPKVVIECEAQRLEGTLLISMPENQSRVVDYLNRPEPFLTLRAGDRHHLIQKKRITRVLETREA